MIRSEWIISEKTYQIGAIISDQTDQIGLEKEERRGERREEWRREEKGGNTRTDNVVIE